MESLEYSRMVAAIFQPQAYSDFSHHADFEEAFARYTQYDKYRGLDFSRIWALVLNCKHALSRTQGAVAELGVYQGQGASLLSLYAEKFERKLYLCDTFEGFPETQLEENMNDEKKIAFKDNSLAAAQTVVGNYSGLRWVVGMFPDSVTDEMQRDKFAFVSIDCDIYEPILAGLDFFWPRMQREGMIFVHDYASGHWPGATRAVDEFCAKQKVAGCILPDLASSYVLAKW